MMNVNMGRNPILIVAAFVILTPLVGWSNALKCFSTVRGSSSSSFAFGELKGLFRNSRHPDICISMRTEGQILDHKFGKTSAMGAHRSDIDGLLPLVDDTCFTNNGTFEFITICGCSTDWCNNNTFGVDPTMDNMNIDYENEYEQPSVDFIHNGQEYVKVGFWTIILIFTQLISIIMQI